MNWRDRSGLSLMELLVSLALVAVITGALATATNFGVQLLNRTQALQATDPQIALRLRLRQWMTTATPPSRLVGFPTELRGSAAEVSFTTLSPAPFAPNSAALRLSLQVSERDLTLQIDELNDVGDVINSHERTLATGIENVQISYYSNDTKEPGWQNSWEDPTRLPTVIRITTEGESNPPWPELSVRLALAQQP